MSETHEPDAAPARQVHPESSHHPDHAAHPEPAEHPNQPYMLIWGVLAILMFGKVGVSLVGMPQWLSITLLILISLTSALLVALYYMHLRFEPRSLWILAAVPLPLILILIFVVIQEFR